MLEAIHALYVSAKVDVPKSETGRTMPGHSLRHTFALPTIKERMGHSDIATTMRYVTVTEAQLDAAIARAFGASGQPVGNRSGKRA